jgi:hypothetical protein
LWADDDLPALLLLLIAAAPVPRDAMKQAA